MQTTPETFQGLTGQQQIQISSRPACRPLPRARLRPTLSLAIHAQRIGRFCLDVLSYMFASHASCACWFYFERLVLYRLGTPSPSLEGKATMVCPWSPVRFVKRMCGS